MLCYAVEGFYCDVNVCIRSVDMQFIYVIRSSVSIPLKVFIIVIDVRVKFTGIWKILLPGAAKVTFIVI
jgi:hypothetical protein